MISSPTILLVEDEKSISDLIKLNLELDGYQVVHTIYTKEAIKIITDRDIDLVILDVMLPDGNGIDTCATMKSKLPQLPVLMLSALGQSADKVRGLRAGADDYLAKPFNLEELLLRVQGLLKRNATDDAIIDQFEIGHARIDLNLMHIITSDQTYEMSAKECELLRYMITHVNRALSRQAIIEKVWGSIAAGNSRTIDNFVSTFRKLIEENPSRPQYIKTVRGVGYMLLLSPEGGQSM